jgi:hypothetical protein
MSPFKMPTRLARSIKKSRAMLSKLKNLPKKRSRSIRRFSKLSSNHKLYLRGGGKCFNCGLVGCKSDLCKEEKKKKSDEEKKKKEKEKKKKEEKRAIEEAEKAEEARQAKEKRVAKISEKIKNPNPLITKLYLNDSEREQDETTLWANYVKMKRQEYIYEWFRRNNYTPEISTIDLLAPCIDRAPVLMRDRMIKMRQEFNDHSYDKSITDVENLSADGEQHLFLGGITPTISQKNKHDAFLREKKLLVYSVDSLNKNITTKDGTFLCSPYSLEVHCTIIKPLDLAIFPRNFYGHVTVIVIGNIDDQDEIINLKRPGHKDASNFEKQFFEKAKYGRTFHYGMLPPQENGEKESTRNNPVMWQTKYTDPVNQTKPPTAIFADQTNNVWHEQFVTEDEINIGGITWFPEHNRIQTLLKQYYLKCIQSCFDQDAFKGIDDTLGFPLTYKDLTNWGNSSGSERHPAFPDARRRRR